jgi:uncharacterized protein YrrD
VVLSSVTVQVTVYWGVVPYSLVHCVYNSGILQGVLVSPGLLEDMLQGTRNMLRGKYRQVHKVSFPLVPQLANLILREATVHT